MTATRRTTKPLDTVTDEATASAPVPAAPAAAPAAPPRESIRFHVRRLVNGTINITSSLSPDKYPKLESTIACLPAKHRKPVREFMRRNNYYDLQSLITQYWGAITVEEWAEALCTAALRLASASDQGECSTSVPLKNVFMALDDTLYKLSPISMVGTNRALATVRKRALSEAQTAGDLALANATTKAAEVVNEANAAAQAIYTKARTVQEEARIAKAALTHIPPEWLLSSTYPFFWNTRQWRVLCWVNLKITEFIYETSHLGKSVRRKWAALNSPYYIQFYFSAAIGNEFSVSNIATVGNVYLPHMTPEKFCGQPADAPATINSAADVARLTTSISRTLAKVDLHSMLAAPQNWDARMWNYVPEDLKKLLNGTTDWNTALERFCRPPEPATPEAVKTIRQEREIEVIDQAKENRETWTS